MTKCIKLEKTIEELSKKHLIELLFNQNEPIVRFQLKDEDGHVALLYCIPVHLDGSVSLETVIELIADSFKWGLEWGSPKLWWINKSK